MCVKEQINGVTRNGGRESRHYTRMLLARLRRLMRTD
jgi:hypothetical protein